MAYGVTPDGFVRPRLPEVRQEIVTALRTLFLANGIEVAPETRPDSVMGMLIDTFAERETAMWEAAEGVYYAMYPGSASNISLDRSVSFTGVTRYQDEKSRAYVVLYGAQGTVVPAGAQLRRSATQSVWALAQAATISSRTAADLSLRPVVAPNTDYVVTLDGRECRYRSGATTNLSSILGGLVAAVAQTGLDTSSDGAVLRVHTDGRTAVVALWSASLELTRLGTPALVLSLAASTESAAPGELTGRVTQISGWDDVNNLQAGVAGRLAENDAELRARYPTGLFRLGAATLPSIAPNVRDRTPGVRAIKVFENSSDSSDEIGRPPHSVHVVVDGGLDDEVALAVFNTVAAGIDTHGATSVVLTDIEGGKHTVRFDRPERVYLWVKCATTLLPPAEQAFPPDGFDQIKANLAATGDGLSIGDDVILQRLFGAIYKTPGLAVVDLRLAWSTNPAFVPATADYHEANVTIKDFQVAVFDTSRIEVT